MSSICVVSENFEIQKPIKTSYKEVVSPKYSSLPEIAIRKSVVMDVSKTAVISNEIDVYIGSESYNSTLDKMLKGFYKKTGAVAMSFQYPASFLAFKDELHDLYANGIWMKLGMAAIFSSLLSYFKVPLETILTGVGLFVVIALCDAILGKIPNSVRDEEKKKEHTLLAKLWSFIGHSLAMTVGIAMHLFLSTVIKDPNFLQKLFINCHYIIFAWICLIYFQRVLRYVASLNNTKVPESISGILPWNKD
ncbi:hypothetical protein CN630_19790 [Bacillus wiedmannii]|uniref:hypothetical protein n=1 Tax=Bacillus wiedmannii TaxID=1890302 RepID=UPI000BF6256C|nr:hypothetical protein [Bacillus wiedmannii]PEN45022.1 hypothetical protein CN630_19790 [Bacillus wiedmannii]